MPAWFRTFVWGLFCACSWTWCIGMYLPIVMLERYGWPGFVAFAVPNVVGCTLFGYVLRTPERSRRLVERHAGAVRWFSVVTIAFHLYFAGWLAVDLLPAAQRSPALPVALPLMLCAIGLLLGTLRDRAWLVLAVIVYALSLTAFVALAPDRLADLPARGALPSGDLVPLVPMLLFGFLLCPYLDPTFHRALQRAGSPHAFAVFGVAFAVMIVLTCAYWGRPGIRLDTIVLAHLAAQAAFTVGAHYREIVRLGGTNRPAWLLAPLLAVGVVYLTRLAPDPEAAAADTYLRFLVFYGALFPAYVLVMVGVAPGPTRRRVIALLVVTALLAPFDELGMLHGRPWLLVPPILVYAAWAIVARGRPRGAAGPS